MGYSMNTKDSLCVFWPKEHLDNDGKKVFYHEECSGVIFFGYWLSVLPSDTNFLKKATGIWSEYMGDLKFDRWESEDYNCFAVSILISTWPSSEKWRDIIKETLKLFIEEGAVIAWCGDEECSPSIDCFIVGKNAGNVYSAYTLHNDMVCNSNLDEEYKVLGDAQLLMLCEDFLFCSIS